MIEYSTCILIFSTGNKPVNEGILERNSYVQGVNIILYASSEGCEVLEKPQVYTTWGQNKRDQASKSQTMDTDL